MVPSNSCKYVCNGAEWELVSGTAPPGYFCPEISGACDDPGQVAYFPPWPIDDPVDPDDPPMNAQMNFGEYQYASSTDSLYFSRGDAEEGFRFKSKMTMGELRQMFPAVAAEVDLLKNAKSLANFTVMVPAIQKP